jgi:glycosyltransferase involved in cell wall biosynthesis
MKILVCHNYYRSSAPSGEDAVANNEVKLLKEHGHEVITYNKFNDDLDDSSLINKLIIAKNTIWSNSTYKELTDFLAVHKPDITHFHNTFPQISPSAYSACKNHGVPVIQTIHNYRFICPGALLQRKNVPCEDCVGNNFFPALRHRCYRNSLSATGTLVAMISFNRLVGSYHNNIDRYIALTEFAASRLIAGGLPKEKIVTKPNYLPEPPIVGSGGTYYAVYVGRLSEEKGLRTLLDAFDRVRSLQLKVLGDGPLRAELEATAKSKNLNIEFMGFQDKDVILSTIRNALVQIVPSEWYEGFPMVILEAFACGTPVIASRIGSLTEVIKSGITGYHFTAGNSKELASCINNIATIANSQPNQYHQIRTNSRLQFENHFTAERNIKLLTNIYEEAIRSSK